MQNKENLTSEYCVRFHEATLGPRGPLNVAWALELSEMLGLPLTVSLPIHSGDAVMTDDWRMIELGSGVLEGR